MPDCVRSISKSRSNSATAAITCMVILLAALVRSTPPKAKQCTRTLVGFEPFDGGAHIHGIAPESVQFRHHPHIARLQTINQTQEARTPAGGHRTTDALLNDPVTFEHEARRFDLLSLIGGNLLGR